MSSTMLWHRVVHSSSAPSRQFVPAFDSRKTGFGRRHLRHVSPAVLANSRVRRSCNSSAETRLRMTLRALSGGAKFRIPHNIAMKIPVRLKPLLEEGVIEGVVRQLMSGKEAMVYVV